MKQETLKKANNLEHDISEYTDLLRSRNADYHTMLVKIACAYSNNREDYHGRVSNEVWNKMLDVVAEERRKAMQELENLTDDATDADTEIITDVPEPDMTGGKSKPADKPHKDSWTDKIERSFERLMSWLLYSMTFCILLGVAGLQLSTREAVAYSLMLGLITGSINNLERVIRELFGKKED